VGLELGLFNKLTLTTEYYSRRNEDLIKEIDVAQEEGFTKKIINFASMTNKGIDITLGIKNILNHSEFQWGMNFIYGYVKNKVIGGELESSLLTQITRPAGYPLNGHPLESLYAFRYAYLNSDGRPMFYKGDQVINGILSTEKDRSLIEYAGSRQPTSTGSFANSFTYKGIELRAFFTYAFGHKVFMSPLASRTFNDDKATPGELVYRWSGIGDEQYTDVPGILSTIQRTHLNTLANIDELAYNRSNFRIADASTVRLSELMLSYNFNNKTLAGIPGIKNARLILSANNLYFWASKKLRGVDPELLLTGVALPNPRSYSIRLTASF